MLNDTKIKALKTEQSIKKVPDYDGLYIYVFPKKDTDPHRKTWYVRYRVNDKQREMVIGKYPDMTLEEAREKTKEVRSNLKSGADPVKAKKNSKD